MAQSATNTPQGLCAIVRPYIATWPVGQVRDLSGWGVRNLGTIALMKGIHVLAWISINEHGQVMEQLMAFDFRGGGMSVFLGYEKGPASKARVIRTTELRQAKPAEIRDEEVRDCLLAAVREIQEWPENTEFCRDWGLAQHAAVDVVIFCAPVEPVLVRSIPDKVTANRTSPEGQPF